MDLLCGRESKLLTDSRPAEGPTVEKLSTEANRLNDEYHFYACTQTVSHQYKVGTRYLYKMTPSKQMNVLKELIRSSFSGYVYLGIFEYTQNNVIHCHMLVAHKHIHCCNSVVRAGITDILRQLGKVQYCEKISDFQKYFQYMTKEYEPLLNNIVCSSDFNLY